MASAHTFVIALTKPRRSRMLGEQQHTPPGQPMEPPEAQQARKASDMPIADIRSYFDAMDQGLKTRAMHDVYEDQQKRVIELQREQMDALDKLAVAAVKARAAAEQGRQQACDQLIQEVMEPLRAQLRTLTADLEEANALLVTYQAIGQGMV
jgi:glutamine synthetase type III